MAWLREEVVFMAVASQLLAAAARCTSSAAVAPSFTGTCTRREGRAGAFAAQVTGREGVAIDSTDCTCVQYKGTWHADNLEDARQLLSLRNGAFSQAACA